MNDRKWNRGREEEEKNNQEKKEREVRKGYRVFRGILGDICGDHRFQALFALNNELAKT